MKANFHPAIRHTTSHKCVLISFLRPTIAAYPHISPLAGEVTPGGPDKPGSPALRGFCFLFPLLAPTTTEETRFFSRAQVFEDLIYISNKDAACSVWQTVPQGKRK